MKMLENFESILNQLKRLEEERSRKHKVKPVNNYNVTELLQCREKTKLIREGYTPVPVESNVSRQATISNYVHSAIQANLGKLGYQSEVKYKKRFGNYTLHCRVDAVDDKDKPTRIIEIKVPIRNNVIKSGIPDYYKIQIGMYLSLTDAEECVLLILANNAITEHVLTERVSDDDVIWLIEEGAKVPWFEKECNTCYFRNYCDVR